MTPAPTPEERAPHIHGPEGNCDMECVQEAWLAEKIAAAVKSSTQAAEERGKAEGLNAGAALLLQLKTECEEQKARADAAEERAQEAERRTSLKVGLERIVEDLHREKEALAAQNEKLQRRIKELEK